MVQSSAFSKVLIMEQCGMEWTGLDVLGALGGRVTCGSTEIPRVGALRGRGWGREEVVPR